MIKSIRSRSSEDLILLYREVNRELTGNLLDGASWDEQQNRIALLTEISKELSSRKIEIGQTGDKNKED